MSEVANALYDKARQKFLAGELDWDADTIKVVLVDTATYTVDLASDEFLSAIPADERVATSPALTNKSTTAGVADADDTTFSEVMGDPCEALVIFKDTGDPDTSPLIAYIHEATGLPVTPNGGDINVIWDSGPNKIFKL